MPLLLPRKQFSMPLESMFLTSIEKQLSSTQNVQKKQTKENTTIARMKSDASLDEQIEKAQERLDKAKAQYDSAVVDLRKLLEEHESRRQKLLMTAIVKSDKSFEDILRFLESKLSDHDD